MPRGCIVGTMLIHHTSFASLRKFLYHPTGLCEHQQSYHRSCIWGLMIVLKEMDCGSMSWFWQDQNLFLSLFHSFIFFKFPSLQSPSLLVALQKDFSLLWTQNPIMILKKKRTSMREMKEKRKNSYREREPNVGILERKKSLWGSFQNDTNLTTKEDRERAESIEKKRRTPTSRPIFSSPRLLLLSLRN